MLTKIRFMVVLGIAVAISLYIVLINNDSTTIFLAPGSPLTANTGFILILSFFLGIVFMAVIAGWFGLKSYFRERGLQAKEKQRRAFYDGMIEARSYLAADEWQKAKDRWETALKKDPTDIIARVELSRTIEGLADGSKSGLLDALRILDAARAADPKNVEVLFRAAELNLALNNKTAALDNLNLIMYHHPNKKAAILARDIAEDLDRIADAFEYQKQLESLAYSDGSEEVNSRLGFKRLLQECKDDNSLLSQKLREYTKKNSNYAPALIRLAELEADAGRLDDAAQLYVKASKVASQTQAWHLGARLWLKANHPEKALSAAKVATNETKGEARVQAEIELIRLYLALNMLEDARRHLDGMPFLLKREGVQKSRNLMTHYLSLKGLCLSRMGEYQASAEIFKRLSEHEPELQDFVKDIESVPSSSEAPAPRLSTP